MATKTRKKGRPTHKRAQTRRGGAKVDSADVTRETPSGMPGRQPLGDEDIGGRVPPKRRASDRPRDMGVSPAEPPLASSVREQENERFEGLGGSGETDETV
jgi:hypothetical protein